MKRPIQPTKPTLPYSYPEPQPKIKVEKEIKSDYLNYNSTYSFDEIKEIFMNDVDFSLHKDIRYEFEDYDNELKLRISCLKEIDNPNYDNKISDWKSEQEKFKKNKEKYTLDLEKYYQDMIVYEIELDKYNQEIKNQEIEKLEKKLKELKK